MSYAIADVITLGIGTPSDIPSFVLVGLASEETNTGAGASTLLFAATSTSEALKTGVGGAAAVFSAAGIGTFTTTGTALELIPQGIGTPSTIPGFILLGLTPFVPTPLSGAGTSAVVFSAGASSLALKASVGAATVTWAAAAGSLGSGQGAGTAALQFTVSGYRAGVSTVTVTSLFGSFDGTLTLTGTF